MKTNTITRKFGKLLRIDVAYDNEIRELKITGDFFMHPEETLEQIVSELTGMKIPFRKEELISKLNYIIHSNEAELIGLTTEDIANTLQEVTQ